MKTTGKRILLLTLFAMLVGCSVLSACSPFGNWVVTKEPTCVEAGERTRYSKKDESVFETEEIPALGHDWGSEGEDGWIVLEEPTYETEGLAQRVCKRCHESETKTLDMLEEPVHLKIMDGATLLEKVYVNEDGTYDLTGRTEQKTGYTFLKFVDASGNDFPLTGSLTANGVVYTDWSVIPTTTLAQLCEYAAAGVDKIHLAADLEITESVFVVGQTEIYATEDHSLVRGTDFGGDLFIVGETAEGENTQVVFGKQAALTLKPQNDATLTISGNKDAVTATVGGAAILILHSGVVNLYDGVTVQDCKKVTNGKVLESRYAVSYPERIGGAAVIVVSGTFNMYGGALLRNEVNLDETDDSGERASSCGGAIYSNANVNIYGGVLSENRAARGGAIYNYRTAQIEGGELSANAATVYGGAVYLPGSQYAQLFLGEENATENLVTLSENTAGKSGGAIFGQMKNSITVYGGVTFSENAAVGNGGAINTSGALTVTDGSFYGNTAGSKGGAVFVYYSDPELTTRQVYLKDSLFEANEASKGGAVAFSSSSEDLPNGAIGTIEHTVFRKNEAFMTETDDPELSDQEGEETGLFNGKGGAVYAARKSDVTITGATFIENGAENKGGAGYFTGGSTVTIAGTTFQSNTSDGKAGALYITEASTVTISGDSDFTGNAAVGSGGAILCYTDATLTVSNTTFTGNTSADDTYGGGAMYFAAGSNGTLQHVTLTGNAATVYNGGAIGVYGKSHVVINSGSLFKENTAARYGGAIYAATADSHVEVRASIFEGNSAVGNGGAVYGYTGTVFSFDTCIFTGNEADGNGGALYFSGATVTLTAGACVGNTAGGTGGAIGAYSSTVLTVNGTAFRNNAATTNGGALYFSKSQGTLTRAAFTSNEASGNGGAAYVTSTSSVEIGDSTFTGNQTDGKGGALYVTSTSDAEINGSTFTGNQASGGGALYADGTSTVDTDGVTFEENHATSNGGAIYIYEGAVCTMRGVSTFTENTAGGNGGAAYVSKSNAVLKIQEVSATGNSANQGGFLFLTTTGTTVYIYGGTIRENTAPTGATFYGNAAKATLHLKMSNITTDYDSTGHDTSKFALDTDFDEEWAA